MRIALVLGDITKQQVDVVVNAANGMYDEFGRALAAITTSG